MRLGMKKLQIEISHNNINGKLKKKNKKKITLNLHNLRTNIQTHHGQPEETSQNKILNKIADALRYNTPNLSNAQQ